MRHQQQSLFTGCLVHFAVPIGARRSDAVGQAAQGGVQTQLQIHGHGPLPLTPYPHAQLKAAAASGQLQKPSVMPRLPAPGSVPLLPAATSSGRAGAHGAAGAGPSTSTQARLLALPSSTPQASARSGLGLSAASGAAANALTPMPRKLFQGSGPGSAFGTPISAAGPSVGAKRGWDSSSATPLLESGSGIKRLAGEICFTNPETVTAVSVSGLGLDGRGSPAGTRQAVDLQL